MLNKPGCWLLYTWSSLILPQLLKSKNLMKWLTLSSQVESPIKFDMVKLECFRVMYGKCSKFRTLINCQKGLIELRVRLAPLNRFKPSSKIFYWPFQGGTSFVDLLCFCSVLCLLSLCASVYMCFVVTCWERADLLALVCGVFCEFVTFALVSWVRCGTWLYRFLIFAPLLT